jgi:RNA polymerase sigma-70 factor (ECF subfamily)
MVHLDAAYNLARFLMRNEHDAEDVTQEACLRAFRFFDSFRGGNSRAWFLTIVRNTAFTALNRTRVHEKDVAFDEELHAMDSPAPSAGEQLDRRFDQQTVRDAIEALPPEFRQTITLRDLDGCSYKEIADITGVPVGTVMSRLSRARADLRRLLVQSAPEQNKS